MRKQLFDRFDSAGDGDFSNLAFDLSDILGARRAIEDDLPGVLSWGLPGLSLMSPQSDKDRKKVARLMEEIIMKFEPRLEEVEVVPSEGSNDFSFQLKANLVGSDDESIRLRILTPRRGGGLGAEIAIVGGSNSKTATIEGGMGSNFD